MVYFQVFFIYLYFHDHFITFPGTSLFFVTTTSSFTLLSWHLLSFSSCISRVSRMSAVSTFSCFFCKFLYVQFKFHFCHYHFSFLFCCSIIVYQFPILFVKYPMVLCLGGKETAKTKHFAACV